MRLSLLLVGLLLAALALSAAARAEDMTFKVESNLRAAAARVDITPPPGTPIFGHVREHDGVRTQLHAAVLLFDDGRTRAVPVVVGYANGSIGYICTDQAHKEGGYEPNNSQSGPGAEGILIAELRRLADQVIGDTFDSFAPPAATANRKEDR